MTEHVIGFAEPRGERQHHAAGEVIRESADAVADHLRDDRGLGEVRVARVQNDRLAPRELVIERDRESRVPTFGELSGDPRRIVFRSVVVDVEVRGLEDRECKAVVLNLIPAEILRIGRRGRQQEHTQCDDGSHHLQLKQAWPSR